MPSEENCDFQELKWLLLYRAHGCADHLKSMVACWSRISISLWTGKNYVVLKEFMVNTVIEKSS